MRQRLTAVHGIEPGDVNVETIGAGAAFRGRAAAGDPVEVRLRVAARTASEQHAGAVGWEVESLYTNCPAGGGGARSSVTMQVAVRSCLLPRELAATRVDARPGAARLKVRVPYGMRRLRAH